MLGRGSPEVTKMKIKVRYHSKTDRDNLNVFLFDYCDDIGDKRYCSYNVIQDKIYFMFYSDNSDDRYTLYSLSAKKDFIPGMPLCFQMTDCLDAMAFVSDLSYPVYRTDDNRYVIFLKDTYRSALFDVIDAKYESKRGKSMKKSVEINSQKLRTIFAKRGLNISEVAKSIGYQSSGFSTALRNARLTYQTVAALKNLYNIDFEEYKLEEVDNYTSNDVTDNVVDIKSVFEEIQDSLYQLMYSAMYNAVKQALKE